MTAPFRIVAVSAFALAGLPASAATFFFTDTPYRSSADIPVGFYAGGSPVFLEDFEDGSLDGGITVTSTSWEIRTGTAASGVDSVEYPGPDGVGSSLRSPNVTITFSAPVTAAGLVWTDGGRADYTFEAFDAHGFSLGSLTESLGVAGSFVGDGGDEDRFFGVTSLLGIKSISLAWIGNDQAAHEFDHIQYGRAADPSVIPLPAGLPLLLAGLGAFAIVKRRSRG